MPSEIVVDIMEPAMAWNQSNFRVEEFYALQLPQSRLFFLETQVGDLNIIKNFRTSPIPLTRNWLKTFFEAGNSEIALQYVYSNMFSLYLFQDIMTFNKCSIKVLCNNVHKNQQGGDGSETGFFPS